MSAFTACRFVMHEAIEGQTRGLALSCSRPSHGLVWTWLSGGSLPSSLLVVVCMYGTNEDGGRMRMVDARLVFTID